MELMLVIRMLLRRWYLIVIPVVIVALLSFSDLIAAPAASGGYSTVIRYTAAQVLEALPARDGDYQDVWLASELTVNAFNAWVRSSRFAEEVNDVLAKTHALTLDTRGRFSSDSERSIGQIFVSWEDAETLQKIADAAVLVLQTRSNDYFPQLGEVPAVVNVLDEPVISAAPPPLTNRLRPLLQIAVALVVGVGLATLAEYLDPWTHRPAQIEALGVPVLAVIPKD